MNKPSMKRLKELSDFADLSSRIYFETGISPMDYESSEEYMEAVLSVTETECLTDWESLKGKSGFDSLVNKELKKRGEIKNEKAI